MEGGGGEAERLMKGPDNLFLPSPLSSRLTPPNPSHSVPRSTFCKYLLNILVVEGGV